MFTFEIEKKLRSCREKKGKKTRPHALVLQDTRVSVPDHAWFSSGIRVPQPWITREPEPDDAYEASRKHEVLDV